MVKTFIALRHMSDKEFGVGFREMKKLSLQVFIGFLFYYTKAQKWIKKT